MSSEQKFGLSSESIFKIKNIFREHRLIEKSILYGSRAKGNYRPNSDIDITLVAPKMTTQELLKIENELDDLLLPYKIDLSLFHTLENSDLVEHIQRVGIEF